MTGLNGQSRLPTLPTILTIFNVTTILLSKLWSVLWSYTGPAAFVALSLALSQLIVPQRSDSSPSMQVKSINGYQVRSAEYWLFVENIPFRYPDDVISGFYPREVKHEVVGCAEQAYDQLTAYLNSNPYEFSKARPLGVTTSIVIMINDYTKAARNRQMRPPRMSHWAWGEQDFTKGYWRWEASLDSAGICHLPCFESAQNILLRAIATLSPLQKKWIPNFGHINDFLSMLKYVLDTPSCLSPYSAKHKSPHQGDVRCHSTLP